MLPGFLCYLGALLDSGVLNYSGSLNSIGLLLHLGSLMIEILAMIDAPHFHAGIVLWDDVVIEAAPIVIYMKRQKWTRARVRDYCAEKGWTVSVVHQVRRPKA